MRVLSERLGIALLMLLASVFAGNQIAARLAFDHGTSVSTAIGVRACVTAVVMLVLIRLQGVPAALPRATLLRGVAIGLLVAAQGYCLYSAVARIPVGLALLAFNTFPMLLVLLTWALTGERPPRRALVALPIALCGLVLALDVVGSASEIEGRWHVIGTGVNFALCGACSFSVVLFLTTRWLKEVDGRVRTLLLMTTTAVVVSGIGAATHTLALPADREGWLGLGLLTLLYGSAITAVFTVVPRLKAASNTVALNFEPVMALILGWAILGQSISPLQIFGACLVVGAIVYLSTGRG